MQCISPCSLLSGSLSGSPICLCWTWGGRACCCWRISVGWPAFAVQSWATSVFVGLTVRSHSRSARHCIRVSLEGLSAFGEGRSSAAHVSHACSLRLFRLRTVSSLMCGVALWALHGPMQPLVQALLVVHAGRCAESQLRALEVVA